MYNDSMVEQLNKNIREHFSDFVSQIHPNDKQTRHGVGRLVFLDRYSYKDISKVSLEIGDIVILTVKPDPNFPARGVGKINSISGDIALIEVEDEFVGLLNEDELVGGDEKTVRRTFSEFEKPMELYYEQIARRVARGLAEVETDEDEKQEFYLNASHHLANDLVVPAGRVLYGAGAGTEVTYFNCYVLPFIEDSRGGISAHREKTMEIMSRGGGVGTNGSTLRPKHALAKGVNGRSSGSVSWLNDLANLTNLVEQGGSRRGAQMIMLNDNHPDIFEFVISKMQNPAILRLIIETNKNKTIVQLAKDKLKFTPLSESEKRGHLVILESQHEGEEYDQLKQESADLLKDGGRYSVHNPEFLAGANISVNITDEFMEAVENRGKHDLRFPDVDSMNKQDKAIYDRKWKDIGDVRVWEAEGMPTKIHQTIDATDLWDLINVCATYSAEPGIFYIDNANKMTNASSYGQKVVATNPCGEQPLAPYSVCNLLAINLAEMSKDGKLDRQKLVKAVRIAVQMGDNVIDATPYFLEENKKQALGERRIGLGVMGLADLLIDLGIRYGSDESIRAIDDIFKIIAKTAYNRSSELAVSKGSFPFLENNADFLETGFMKEMPEEVRENICKNGVRNSHILTVAPTGSTGTMIGVSTGLEPYFAFKYFRSGRLGKFIEVNAPIVEKFLKNNPNANPDQLPDEFVSSMEITPLDHVRVQCAIQRWVDSSISKTVNAPAGFTVKDVQTVYEELYKGGAKGGTVYVDGSRNSQVLTLTNDTKEEPKEKKVFLDETVRPLRETNVNYGNEIGDVCPVCRIGHVVDRGGCTECDNCSVQLKCGI